MRNRGGRGVQAAIAAMAATGITFAVSEAGAQSSVEYRVGVNDAALRFTPETIKVTKGGTVVWNFAGSTTVHNIVTENDVAADPAWKDFSTPPAGADGEFRYTFNELGVYDYLCDLHRVQGMVGKIEVVDGPVSTPEATPRPLITATPIPTAAAPPAATRDTPAPTPKWAADKTAPALTKVSGARSGATGAKVKWTLSESAALTLKFTKGKSKTSLRTVRLAGRAGTSSLIVRGGKLVKGRYNVQIDARDRAGNRSTARTTVRIGR
ncbi:plastocyanin/azurin family copper-binding protein [Solirubrobacter taibaiensis]|nr:plastocyanin/azurin family copper-binding protein [Solirubrobacter taibaiensis]